MSNINSDPNETHLETDGLDSEDDAGKEPLVRDKAIEAADVFGGVAAFIHQGVQWGTKPTTGRMPAGEHLVARAVRDFLSVPRVVKEIVMRPVVQRRSGNKL